MTERNSPSRHNHSSSDDSIQPDQPTARPDFQPGTYVVQIPQDQINQATPRESSSYGGTHRIIPEKANGRSRCLGNCCICCCISLFVLIILLLLLYIFLQPKLPQVDVERLIVDRAVPGFRTEFRIELSVHNPNPRTNILYKRGVVVLTFSEEQQLIGNGTFPSFTQQRNVSTSVDVVIKQANSNGFYQILEMERVLKRLTHQVYVSVVIKVKMKARFERWSFVWGDEAIAVACDLTVYTLARSSMLLSQSCQTDKDS